MNPNLVGATGMELEFQQAGSRPAGDNFPVRFGGPTPSADGHALTDDGVATDRSLPGAGIAAGAAEDKGQVGFLRFAFAKLATKFPVGGIIFCGHQESGGFAVETMNDPRAVGSASRREIFPAVVKEGSGKGTCGSAGARMDMHARRLVDDQEVGVLVKNFKGDRFRGDIPGGRRRDADRDDGIRRQKIPRAHGFFAQGDQSLLHPLLDARA